MTVKKVIAAAALAALPASAHAYEIVASSSDSIARFFRDEGASVEVTEDNVGDPKLRVEYYGTDFVVYFYGCEDNRNCDSVQFFSGYQTEGAVRIARANEWNAENRFSRAYISDSGSARIEHDVFLGRNGMTADDFASLVSRWTGQVNDFEAFIDW